MVQIKEGYFCVRRVFGKGLFQVLTLVMFTLFLTDVCLEITFSVQRSDTLRRLHMCQIPKPYTSKTCVDVPSSASLVDSNGVHDHVDDSFCLVLPEFRVHAKPPGKKVGSYPNDLSRLTNCIEGAKALALAMVATRRTLLANMIISPF
jgi:hypothetical protein